MRITHGRVTLALHDLGPAAGVLSAGPLPDGSLGNAKSDTLPARRDGPALLLLHALSGSSRDWGTAPAAWQGPVYALDFAGHGASDWVAGGVYYPENLAADIDAALQHISQVVSGGAAIAGAGLGAYLGLLVAGARPDLVSAALLLPGPGLDGGGPAPDLDAPFPDLDAPAPAANGVDPMVRLLDVYVRPVAYVVPFADAARRVLLVEDDTPRPPWWEAVRRSPTVECLPADRSGALARLRAAAVSSGVIHK